MENENKDRVVLITGASRGIGEACAYEFAKNGYKNIVINYTHKRTEIGIDVHKNLEKMGVNCFVYMADMGDKRDIDAMHREVMKKFGRIDVLVNNAGIEYKKPFGERTDEEMMHLWNVNYFGPLYLTRIVAEDNFRNARNSAVINVASTSGMQQGAFYSNLDYCNSKAALINMTYALKWEFSPYVRINAVSPGWVDTLHNNLTEEEKLEEMSKIPLGKFANPKQIAESIVFLSRLGGYENGENFVINGGGC